MSVDRKQNQVTYKIDFIKPLRRLYNRFDLKDLNVSFSNFCKFAKKQGYRPWKTLMNPNEVSSALKYGADGYHKMRFGYPSDVSDIPKSRTSKFGNETERECTALLSEIGRQITNMQAYRNQLVDLLSEYGEPIDFDTANGMFSELFRVEKSLLRLQEYFDSMAVYKVVDNEPKDKFIISRDSDN